MAMASATKSRKKAASTLRASEGSRTTPHSWTYSVGPTRHSWHWYAGVIVVGLFVAGLLRVASPDDPLPALTMLVWTCAMVSMSLIPRIQFEVRLDRQSLTIQRLGRRQVRDYVLTDFATYQLTDLPADRRNPRRRTIILRPRNGRTPVELVLPEDASLAQELIEKIAEPIAPAPDIESTPLEKLEDRINRWAGWR